MPSTASKEGNRERERYGYAMGSEHPRVSFADVASVRPERSEAHWWISFKKPRHVTSTVLCDWQATVNFILHRCTFSQETTDISISFWRCVLHRRVHASHNFGVSTHCWVCLSTGLEKNKSYLRNQNDTHPTNWQGREKPLVHRMKPNHSARWILMSDAIRLICRWHCSVQYLFLQNNGQMFNGSLPRHISKNVWYPAHHSKTMRIRPIELIHIVPLSMNIISNRSTESLLPYRFQDYRWDKRHIGVANDDCDHRYTLTAWWHDLYNLICPLQDALINFALLHRVLTNRSASSGHFPEYFQL